MSAVALILPEGHKAEVISATVTQALVHIPRLLGGANERGILYSYDTRIYIWAEPEFFLVDIENDLGRRVSRKWSRQLELRFYTLALAAFVHELTRSFLLKFLPVEGSPGVSPMRFELGGHSKPTIPL
jgi:hypothetical protein